jgi:glyoxylase-like metal-dependent hydrolase (beta-lactamase superfamily II)
LNQENRVSLTPAIFPILVFYLETDGSRILIDTGAPNPTLLNNVLRQAGVMPREIDTVILTHLHFDHCANAALFPTARFILQHREWEFAQHPDPSQRDIYMPELIAEVEQRDLLLVDDNFQVAHGVSVHLVPGHTPGQQAVSVSTVDGTYVVAGDLFNTFSNINPAIHKLIDLTGKSIPIPILAGQDFYPPSILIDLNDWHASVHKLLAIAGSRERIIPSHEPSVSGRFFPAEPAP